jgi:hypothetical protein
VSNPNSRSTVSEADAADQLDRATRRRHENREHLPRSPRARRASGGQRVATELLVSLDEFGAQALCEEAARQGVPVEELAAFAVTYYLGDLDSGRITRELPPEPARG